MTKEAIEWRNAQLRKYSTQGQHWPTWDNFKMDFLAKWGESNEAA